MMPAARAPPPRASAAEEVRTPTPMSAAAESAANLFMTIPLADRPLAGRRPGLAECGDVPAAWPEIRTSTLHTR